MSRFKIASKLVALALAAIILVGCGGLRLTDLEETRARAREVVFHSGSIIPANILYPRGIQHNNGRTMADVTEILSQIRHENEWMTNLAGEFVLRPEEDQSDLNTSPERLMTNEYFFMYLGTWGDAYFVCRRTFEIFATNPVFLDFDVEDYNVPNRLPNRNSNIFRSEENHANNVMFSQLDIVYSNAAGRTFTLSSFPDSVSRTRRAQIWHEIGTIERIDENGNVRNNPTVTVHYTIGTNLADFPLMLGMSQDRFEDMSERLLEAVEAGYIELPASRVFNNQHRLLSYEMLSAGVVGFDYDEYIERYPALPTLGYVWMLAPVSPRQIRDLLFIYSLIGVTPQDFIDNDVEMGQMRTSAIPVHFNIPLVYELDGSSIVMSIDTSQIVGSEGFTLEQINLPRTFGATLPVDDGYLFVPDGSGAIIRNDEPARGMNAITMPFFGPDFAKDIQEMRHLPLDTVFPVFGARRNDIGMFAIVEHGAALGGVTAEVAANPVFEYVQEFVYEENELGVYVRTGEYNWVYTVVQVSGDQLPYNRVFPYVTFHDWDNVSIRGTGAAFTRMYTTEPFDTNFTVRYNFLFDDWASYSGWARFYQMYLERTGVLTRTDETIAPADVPLDINFIGSMLRQVNTFGIPWWREEAVTTFTQAETIMDLFRDGGVNSANIIYTGAINGGTWFASPNRVYFQRELGGRSGFNQLYHNMNQNNVNVFNQVDFGRVYNSGNGVTIGIGAHDTSRNLARNQAWLAEFSPATSMRNFGAPISAIVNPLIFNTVANNFIRAYQNVDNRNLYLSTIGYMLNSNFNENMEVSREEAMVLTRDLLARLQDEGFNLMLDAGNAYVLEFADRLVNVPTSSSGQRIESYSIPFTAMVLKGYIPFTGEAINRSGNMHRSFLEAIESGAGLHYTLIYANQLVLIDTWSSGLFSVNYAIWIEDIIERYNRVNEEMRPLTNARIINHERLGVRGTLEHQIVRVTYEPTPGASNGWFVYVNYGREPFRASNGQMVEALDFLVVRR